MLRSLLDQGKGNALGYIREEHSINTKHQTAKPAHNVAYLLCLLAIQTAKRHTKKRLKFLHIKVEQQNEIAHYQNRTDDLIIAAY